jgi:hypothetical protein
MKKLLIIALCLAGCQRDANCTGPLTPEYCLSKNETNSTYIVRMKAEGWNGYNYLTKKNRSLFPSGTDNNIFLAEIFTDTCDAKEALFEYLTDKHLGMYYKCIN